MGVGMAGVGMHVDARRKQRFLSKKKWCETNSGGRIYILCRETFKLEVQHNVTASLLHQYTRA